MNMSLTDLCDHVERLQATNAALLAELQDARDMLISIQVGSDNPRIRRSVQAKVDKMEVVIKESGGQPANPWLREVANTEPTP